MINRHERRLQKLAKKGNISGYLVDQKNKTVMILTKDILTNQIYREGPNIAGSFDELGRGDINDCSEVFSRTLTMLVRHLPNVDDKGSEATCARLLNSAAQTYVAALEVARRGYPREHGALSRGIIETISTVLAIVMDGGRTLDKFHKGTLETTKTIGLAKKALPFIGKLNGSLSNDFVHIGSLHDSVDGPKRYQKGDERFDFVITLSRLTVLLLDIVTELIFSHEMESLRYWRRKGEGWVFEPGEETEKWMQSFVPEEKASKSDGVTVQDIIGASPATKTS
ncbi:hypothetical protein [Brucella sp. NBRC 113783]|uniref:hypothetical protein n=1 Tax=Brucella sp. NBRC 113783 TaxID=3075478 RepID=UPI0029C06D51|nr:hypothetical protein [Brucella sp. NBRC 113783]MDX4076390.1 hypothetical protein [Brucella sp. NBRC 113783]